MSKIMQNSGHISRQAKDEEDAGAFTYPCRITPAGVDEGGKKSPITLL